MSDPRFTTPGMMTQQQGFGQTPTKRPATPSQFAVDYNVITPKGSRARFSRTMSLLQINMARSETAVLAYLQKMHPGTEIQIISLSFK